MYKKSGPDKNKVRSSPGTFGRNRSSKRYVAAVRGNRKQRKEVEEILTTGKKREVKRA